MGLRSKRADPSLWSTAFATPTAVPVVTGDGRSEVRRRWQLFRVYRLRCGHHRAEERRGQNSREPGRMAQSHQEAQHLAGRLIEAQDTERARIARDLHDDVSQQLAGVSIAFSGLKQRLGGYGVSDELQQELVDLQQQTLTLARNVRHLSHDLHPTVLRHLGLEKALASYCGELERSHGVVMRCGAEGEFASIGPEAGLCLYRIAQESAAQRGGARGRQPALRSRATPVRRARCGSVVPRARLSPRPMRRGQRRAYRRWSS